MVNISQKTTSFARTRSLKNLLQQKRGSFNSSPFSNNRFTKTNASTATRIDRSSPFFSCKLAKYYSRSVYFKCSSRFQSLFSLHACSVSCISGIRSKLNNQKRNCIATKKGGNTTSPFQPKRFLPQIVSCSEKRRRPEAGVRFECVKPVYRNRALQNGKFGNIEVSPQQGALCDKFRSHRRLPDGSHASRLPKISSFFVGGRNLRIYR